MADKAKATIVIKKIKKGGHGHHGGAWKVAYADFVTAMMAFFLVMWLMGTDEETKKAISDYFNAPMSLWKNERPSDSTQIPVGEGSALGDNVMAGLAGMNPDQPTAPPVGQTARGEQPNPETDATIQAIKDALDGQAYGFDVNIDYLKFSVPEDVLFKTGTAELSPKSFDYLDRLGKLFKGYRGYIKIEGHTDEHPVSTGAFANAYEFSLARAVSVMNYLVESRWAPEDKFMPVGSGGRRSLASNTTPEGRAQNRRIEFTLSPKKDF